MPHRSCQNTIVSRPHLLSQHRTSRSISYIRALHSKYRAFHRHHPIRHAQMQMHVCIQHRAKAQIAPRRCALLAPCLCSLPLWRAALRSSRSPPPSSDSLNQRSKSSAGASEIPPPTAALAKGEIQALGWITVAKSSSVIPKSSIFFLIE